MSRQAQRGLLIALALLLVAAALALILSALREEISFYKTPKEITTEELGQPLRVGGFVEKGSVRRRGVKISFSITDFEKSLKVYYKGIVPELFREGQGVIAEGRLVAPDQFIANKIFAKHDENYRPPILKELEKNK